MDPVTGTECGSIDHRRRRWLRDTAAVFGAAVAASWMPHSIAAVLSTNRGQARVAEVRAYALPKAVFVQVIADDGTQGWGEAGHEGGRHAARLINEMLDSLVEGRDVFDADGIWSRLYNEGDELGPAGVLGIAISGIDNALWDLRGKLLGMPLWSLLGGRHRDRITLYGSFSRDAGDGKYLTPAECGKRAAALVDQGFATIKLRMSIREENLNPDPDPTIPCVREVRRAIGDDIALYVDPNNGYSAARAIMVGRKLQDEFGVSVYEGPVAKHHWPSLAEVADALDIEVAEGEYAATRWQFRDLILQGRPDVLNLDLGILGGVTEAKKVAALAETFDKPIAVHNARPTLLNAVHLHFLANCAGANRPQEHPGRERLKDMWRYFENQQLPDRGSIAVPDGPGVGLIVNESAVRAAADAYAR
jgi:L-alanine-DL-glutamate epimerase-like enolase superfamily enzyme